MSFSQQTPGDEQTNKILINNCFVHIGNGEIIEDGAVGFSEGKITYVGKSISNDSINEKFNVINARGKHLYPGFIAVNSTLGLVEIDAVRASRDQDEIGDFLPHIRSLVAYNAESKIIESVRPNGVLIAQVTPRGGVISGKSSIMQMDAWNWEDAVIKSDEGIHLNWPSPYSIDYRNRKLTKNKNYLKSVKLIDNFFSESKVSIKQSPLNIPYESMKKIFDGSQTLYLHANYEKQIVDGVSFLKSKKIKNIVLIHGEESENQIDFLKKHEIPVVISKPHRLPLSEDQDLNYPYKLAKTLVDGGLLVSIDLAGSMERIHTRNLPFFAGTFSAFGLEKEEALKLITYNAAKILKIDKNYGSIVKGKSATLILSDGDALDMRSNNISHAYIDGRKISLETHQTKLWNRYQNKYKKQ
tara:strand:+ start:1925 stop:3163 length:1239 start_codon:yes stop_codon:yes gene_type:complete